MMKVKRNKKYNANLKYQQISKLVARRYKIALIEQLDKDVIPIKDNKIIKKWTMAEAIMLTTVRHKWSIVFGYLCRDNFNNTYVKSCELRAQEEYLTEEINNKLNEAKFDLYQTINKSQLLTFFFIATPVANYEFMEDEINMVLDNSKASSKLTTEYERNKYA